VKYKKRCSARYQTKFKVRTGAITLVMCCIMSLNYPKDGVCEVSTIPKTQIS